MAEKDPVELGTNLAIDLKGSTAVVTGSSRGIGKGVALTLARAGADLVGVARSETDLLALGQEITGIGSRFFPVISDLSRADAPAEVASRILDEVGVPGVLVNAAGTIVRVDPPEIEPAQVDAVFAVNVRAPLLLSQAFAAAMSEVGGGSIVNITSLAAEVVTRASVVYQASKAALVQATKALAMRWAPEIRVNAVGPGYVETDLNREWLSRKENRSYAIEQTALGRLGDVQDVANMVAFLASPLSSYVTGQHFIVDGGWGNPW